MNSQDNVERVLKEMHIMFSKSLEVGSMPDKMVINRSEYMNLLDRLTNGIYEMMEEYEQTRQSRMAAERSFRRNADEIIEQANASAEDIYAASVLYTADAIGKIRALIDQTGDSMNELFIQFRRQLRDQKDLLRTHESELQAQLADLSDTRKYLSVLRDINREQERKNRDLEAEREIGNQYARNLFRAAVSPAEVRSGESAAAADGADSARKGSAQETEVTVNRDATYFKWKEKQGQAEEADGAPDEAEPAGKEDKGPRRVTPVQREPEEPYPNEDAIYQQVLEDERRQEAEKQGTGQMGAGEVIKTILFGRDQE